MNELSAALGVVPRTVTTIVDALEKDGMLARLPDPGDRRATLLEITREGLSQLRRSRAMHDSAAAELFDVLTVAQKHQLAGPPSRQVRTRRTATRRRTPSPS
jgi:DNA-binding MarR family transcriptional regulator